MQHGDDLVAFRLSAHFDFVAEHLVQGDPVVGVGDTVRPTADDFDPFLFACRGFMCVVDGAVFVLWQFAVVKPDRFVVFGVDLSDDHPPDLIIVALSRDLVHCERCPQDTVDASRGFLCLLRR